MIDINRTIDATLAVGPLAEAVAAIPAVHRIPVLESAIAFLRPGDPVPGFDGDIMAEAGDWADWATTTERKAYCLACYLRMTAADQRAFLAFIQRRAAA